MAETGILALARGQHGAVTTAQLLACGVTPDQLRHRVEQGWLQRVHRGVYLVGALEAAHSRAMAATLAIGADAVLSHYPAAVVLALRPPPGGTPHVTVTGRAVHPRDGIVIHRTTLHPHDITRRHGIPVTSPARTILDLAASDEHEQALNEARLQRQVSPRSLDEQFSRYPRHRGTAALKESTRADPHFTRSEAERKALTLIRRARLPPPEVNARVEGYEVDLVWRTQKLIVEIDGFAFHSMRSSFEQDRRRDQVLTGRGWRVIRITWRQLTNEPEAVAATLGAALRGPG